MNLFEIINKARMEYLQTKGKYPTHIVLTERQFHLLLQDGAIERGIISTRNKIKSDYCLMDMSVILDRHNLTMNGKNLIMFCDEMAFRLPSDFHDKPLKLYDDTIPLWGRLFNGVKK